MKCNKCKREFINHERMYFVMDDGEQEFKPYCKTCAETFD